MVIIRVHWSKITPVLVVSAIHHLCEIVAGTEMLAARFDNDHFYAGSAPRFSRAEIISPMKFFDSALMVFGEFSVIEAIDLESTIMSRYSIVVHSL